MHQVRWGRKENDGKGFLGVWTEGGVQEKCVIPEEHGTRVLNKTKIIVMSD